MNNKNLICNYRLFKVIGVVLIYFFGVISIISSGGGGGGDNGCNQLTADPGGPYQVYNGRSIMFDGRDSCSPLKIVNWAWDFGDGTVVAGGPTSVHTYWSTCTTGTVENYTVTLTIEDEAGNEDSGSTTLYLSCSY